MATHALDLATIIKALIVLRKKHSLGNNGWNANNEIAKEVFQLLEKHCSEIVKLKDLKCDTEIISPLGIKVTSVLDKTVKWLEGIAKETQLKSCGKMYPAFKLTEGCSIFQVADFSEPLLIIKTKSGDAIWLMMSDQQLESMDLIRFAMSVIESDINFHPDYVWEPEAVIPKVDFNLEPDIGFMVGSSTFGNGNNWTIQQAKQKFKFRMNEKGARVVVETMMVLLGACISHETKKKKIIIDKPFIGWFMQQGVNFPMAVFYCDRDSWKDGGKLSEL